MSIWTHVAGIIRIDVLVLRPTSAESYRKEFEERFGKISTFDDPCDTIIPKGSECSLQYRICDSNDDSCMARFHVDIWGDLRDYDKGDTPEIVEWIKKATKGLAIRDAVISIHTEGHKPDMLFRTDGEWEFIAGEK